MSDKKELKLLKNAFTIISTDFNKFKTLPDNKRTKNYVNGRISILEENYQQSVEFSGNLVSSSTTTAEENEEHQALFEKIRDTYVEYKAELLDCRDKIQTASPTDIPGTVTNEFRLPPISLPEFSGNYEDWRDFYDMFDSLVNSNTSLSDVQKLHYLKSSLSGEAERLLQHLNIQKGNYEKAWTILTTRYDHKRILVNAQLKRFFGQPVLQNESASDLIALIDTSTKCLHCLTNLGIPIKEWDIIIIYILLQKLPFTTQQIWEERLGSSNELPAFKDFSEFLVTRFRTLEVVEQQRPKPSQFVTKGSYSKGSGSIAKNNFHITQGKKEQYKCSVCNKGQHSLRTCKRFLEMSIADRSDTVDKIGVCRNCLAYSHVIQQCFSQVRCYYCQQQHHSLLHPKNTNTNDSHSQSHSTSHSHITPQEAENTNHITYPTSNTHTNSYSTTTQPSTHLQSSVNPNSIEFNPNQPSTSSAVQNYHTQHHNNTQVLLATAIVKVRAASGKYINLRALIDPGSEASFITGSAVQSLGLKNKRTFIEVSGLGKVNSGACHHYVDVTFGSLNSTYEGHTSAFVFKSLTGLLPTQSIDFNKWTHINGLMLADPEYHTPANVDLLLGSDVYADILLPAVVREENFIAPIAQKTELGWILLGKVPTEVPKAIRSFIQTFELDRQLRKFWEIEEEPFEKYEAEEDKACEKHFVKNTKRLPDGRFQVCLPFKGEHYPALGTTYQGALKRFYQLEKRFSVNATLYEGYRKCMSEYINLGHMSQLEKTTDVISTPYHYFIPHHAVFKESSTTTKLRVVYDAAYKTSFGSSLNDHLMVGPKIQNNIIDVILRWRRYRFTFTADMEKMYRQIRMNDKDSNYQLIFWRDDLEKPIKIYRLETVTFGTASAPYLAIRVLHKLADDEQTKFPLAASILREDTYVDDVISGADTIELALEKREEIRNLLASAGFYLRKWTSNNKNVLHQIPAEEQEVDFSLPLDQSNQVKTLGMKWLPTLDVFTFQVAPFDDVEITKRSMLSSIAKLFDPLGWISPSIIKAKMMMQQLWERGLEWDNPVPPELCREWNLFRVDLPSLEKLRIPRWINTGINNNLELHGFCDASEKAYAAALYLRVYDQNKKIHMNLLISKTKVAPLKSVTLPRLELCGAVLLAKLLKETTRALKMTDIKVFAWTDSFINLCWIRSTPSRWETFICNRVAEIQKLTSIDSWGHVPSDYNPADMASRGIFPSQLLECDLWWNGPSFLHNTWEITPPKQPTSFETDEGRRTTKVHHIVREENTLTSSFQHYSSLTKLTRVIASCTRFISNARTPSENRCIGPLTPIDLQVAQRTIIRIVQGEMFPIEIRSNLDKVKGFKSLNPVLDEYGILRVGGRLQNSTLTYDQQHPILLHPTHFFTKLVIRDAHEKTLHGGVQKMVQYIRQKFWIFNIKNATKKYVHSCNVCYRFRVKPMRQLMGQLPAARVTISRPFKQSGVDYAGPIDIKTWKGRNAKILKGYLSIFVCMVTKAVHIEVVSDLTTQAFLAAFRRFTARRGLCSAMYSDCGTNFVGANSELKKLMSAAQFDWKACAESLANDGTKWNFNPPASPHFGGLWEAGVKSIKFHLKRVAGNQVLTYEELTTLLTQVEACLNSRPLCPVTEDINDLQALTPSHFLIGEPLLTPPQPEYDLQKITYLDRWKRVQVLLQSFWNKWRSEYLSRLQQRPKWTQTETRKLMVGDMVFVTDERLPPAKWSLARIKELHPGRDSLVRVATIKTQNGEFKRPIIKLCPLPSNEVISDEPSI